MIEQLVAKFKELKSDEKLLKAQLVSTTAELKTYFEENDTDEIACNEDLVTYKKSVRSKVNEEKLMECIKKLARNTKDPELKKKIRSCVKKVDTVDEDALETLMYEGTISPNALEPAYESTITRTLRLGKVKKAK